MGADPPPMLTCQGRPSCWESACPTQQRFPAAGTHPQVQVFLFPVEIKATTWATNRQMTFIKSKQMKMKEQNTVQIHLPIVGQMDHSHMLLIQHAVIHVLDLYRRKAEIYKFQCTDGF
jgi:hypothetical protein